MWTRSDWVIFLLALPLLVVFFCYPVLIYLFYAYGYSWAATAMLVVTIPLAGTPLIGPVIALVLLKDALLSGVR